MIEPIERRALLAAFITMPYLQNMTPESMVVMWEMDAAEPVGVEFGATVDYGSFTPASSEASGYQGTEIYKAALTDLAPLTEYHYRLVDESGDPLTGDRLFQTGTTDEIDFAFASWGDSQGSNHGAWSADPLEPTTSMMAHMAASDIAFGFTVGDLAESGDSYSDTRNYYLDRVAKNLGQTVPWFNAWGNHDSGNRNAILRRFADMPSQDRPGMTAGFGSYSFTYANTMFIAIDYYDDGVITSGWLEEVLQSEANQAARFTVVGIHVPPYCERWIDGDAWLRSNLVPLMEQYGVDLSISGHTHAYGRGELNGVTYVITGGGSWLDLPEPLVHDWPHMTVGGYDDLPGSWAQQSSYGVLGPPQPIRGGLVNEYVRFEISGNHLQAEVHGFNADGSYVGVLDQFSFGDTPGVNDPPFFHGTSFTEAAASTWFEYAGSLRQHAEDPDVDDRLTFSKVAGPAWLEVAADGALGGVPGIGDVGQNTFTVAVTDTGGLFDTAALRILVQRSESAVAGRFLFYNGSAFDTGGLLGDDAAIAIDKFALMPNEPATFANYTNYIGGINGLIVDVAGAAGTITAADFEFRVGNGGDPAGWPMAPEPSGVTMRGGAGVGGTDRVTITWEHGAIRNQWLQVIVLPSAATGLAAPDVFYFGSAVGEAGNSTGDAKVNVTDMLLARNNPRSFLDPAAIDYPYDYNRDGRVNATDMLIARNNPTSFLDALTLWPQTPSVLITEAGTWLHDYVEIQNVGDEAVDTSGWFVVVNDATHDDPNEVHATLWHLPNSVAVDEVLYRTDDDNDTEHFWNENIYWQTAGTGWVMLVDDAGEVVDFVVWGYPADQLPALRVEVAGHTLRPGNAWSGESVAALGASRYSLQRTGEMDHNDAADWVFATPTSQGFPNDDLTTPFFTGGAPPLWTAESKARPAAETRSQRDRDGRSLGAEDFAWLGQVARSGADLSPSADRRDPPDPHDLLRPRA